jgi:hypothetical protein
VIAADLFRLKFLEARRRGRLVDGDGVARVELVCGPVVFGEFVYRPAFRHVGSVRWKRVGVSGPWIQEFGGVS